MKKFLLILSVMCLLPIFAQAQGLPTSECRPVSQFSVAAESSNVTLNWAAPTSNQIKYYEGGVNSEMGDIAEDAIWMAIRVPSTVLAEYPASAEYPFTLNHVRFLPTAVGTGVTYQVDVYTADPEGPASGDFSAALVASAVNITEGTLFNIASLDTPIEIDQTQDLILAVKAMGQDLTSLAYTESGATNGMSNLVSLDGVNFDYVYESENSLPISWYVAGVVGYEYEINFKGYDGVVEPINGMNVYTPAGFLASSIKSIPEAESVVEYIITRNGEEIATVAGDVLTYDDAVAAQTAGVYTYGISVKHVDNGDECISPEVYADITLNVLTIEDVACAMGEIVTVGVNMDNVDAVAGVQFDVIIPDGMSYVEGSAVLTDRKSASHALVAQMVDANTLRLLAYAMPIGEFSGTTGDIITFQINTEGSDYGVHPIVIEDAVMSDYLGLILSVCSHDGSIRFITDNLMSIGEYTGGTGQTITIGVNLDNIDEVAGFQFDVILPSEVTYVEGSATLTERDATTHTLVASMVDEHTLRVLTYSIPPAVIQGNTGDVLTFDVMLGETVGVYPLDVEAAFLSDIGGAMFEVGTVDGIVNIVPMYTITASVAPEYSGYVEGTGQYAAGSQATLRAISSESCVFVNWTENGVVVSEDAVYTFVVESDRDLVANFRFANNLLSIGNYAGVTGSNILIGVNLDNNDVVSGFQFDIVLPAGISYVDGSAALTERASANHVLVADMIDDQTLRVLAYTMPIGELSGETGDIFTFQVEGEAEGVYPLDITSAALSDLVGTILESGTIDGSVTLSSQPTPQMYEITTTANPVEGGTVTGAGVYEEGTVATVVATANNGYAFVNWTEGGEIVSPEASYSFTVVAGRDLVANFDPIIVNELSIGNYVGNVNDVITLGVNLNNLDEVAGFQFDIILPAEVTYVEESAALTERASANHVLVADMIGEQTLRVLAYSMPPALISGNTGDVFTFQVTLGEVSGTYPVELTEASLAGITGNTFNVTTANGSIAINDVTDVTITATVEPANSGIVIGTGVYAIGEEVVLTAIAAAGFEFVEWKENDVVVSTESQYIFTAASDRNLVAVFEEGFVPPVPCPPVENLVVDQDNLTAELSWNAPADATPYSYSVIAYSGSTIIQSINTSETSAIVKFMEENTYNVQVIALYNYEGLNYISTPVSSDVTIAVNTIDNFTVSNPTLNQISLSWYPSPSDRYNDFYRYQITGGAEVINIYDIDETSYTDYVAGTGVYNYCITVQYGHNGVVSTDPICYEVTVDNTTLFPSPVMDVVNVVNLTAELAWHTSAPSAVLYYNIYHNNVKVGSTASTSFTLDLNNEGLHNVNIEAVYQLGVSNPTNTSFINDVNEVANLIATQYFSEVSLEWTKPADTYYDFSHYVIERGGEEIATVYNINEQSYIDEISAEGTTYTYCVTVVYANGATEVLSQPSCVSIHVSGVFPSVPFVYVETENLHYIANWDDMDEAESYTLYLNGEYLADVLEAEYVGITSVLGNNVLGVVVNYAEGSSMITNHEFRISLNAPENLEAVVEGNQVNLAWTAPSDEFYDQTGYVVLRNGVQIASLGLDVLTYTDMPEHGMYEYCVAAKYRYDYTSAATCTSGVVIGCPVVENLYGNFDVTTGNVELSWMVPAEGSFTYNVYRNNVRIATVSEPAYTDATIDSYDEYTYNVTVVCYDGVESAMSAPFSGSFACGGMPVRNLRAAFDNIGGVPTVTVSWDKPLQNINGQLYNIYRQGELLAENYSDNVYYDETNMPSGTYTYTVVEVCPNGDESAPVAVPVAVETGIEDAEATAFNVYPNPTAGDVTIEGTSINAVVVYNSVGQMVRMIEVNNESQVVVSTSGLTNGVYIFNIVDAEGMAIQKRVVVSR